MVKQSGKASRSTTTRHYVLQLTAIAHFSPGVSGKTQVLTIAPEGLIEGLMRVCGWVAVPVLQQRLSSL